MAQYSGPFKNNGIDNDMDVIYIDAPPIWLLCCVFIMCIGLFVAFIISDRMERNKSTFGDEMAIIRNNYRVVYAMVREDPMKAFSDIKTELFNIGSNQNEVKNHCRGISRMYLYSQWEKENQSYSDTESEFESEKPNSDSEDEVISEIEEEEGNEPLTVEQENYEKTGDEFLGDVEFSGEISNDDEETAESSLDFVLVERSFEEGYMGI